MSASTGSRERFGAEAKKMIKRSDRAGFTLIELLVVIGIAAILTAIALPIGGAVARQRDRSTCFFNLKTIGMALENYRQDFRGFPPDITEPVDWGDSAVATQGLGLYTLYYLTTGLGLSEDDRGAYLSTRNVYHCSRNPVDAIPPALDNPGLPVDATLGGWNNYDGPVEDPHYRRVRATFPVDRQLIQPFPAPTTVVTWCDLHGSGMGTPRPGDRLLVLWVDQTVDWVNLIRPDGSLLDPASATQRQALVDR